MILYLTYNDQPSGVYWSQVTDVVRHLDTLGEGPVRLLALVSPRGFMASRRAIRKRLPGAIVLPMVPRMHRWRSNIALVAAVCRLWRPRAIIARGVMATAMALRLRNKGFVRRVCFDGRGAYAAEWEEYRLIDDDALIAQFRPLEQQAVNDSDRRIAVSQALVEHWRDRYGYKRSDHVVIPCTLGSDFRFEAGSDERVRRAELGYGEADVVLVYAGSTAGWQSFGLLEELLADGLQHQSELRVLFLSREDDNNRRLAGRFPGRVRMQWLDPAQVQRTLCACDLGILVREGTVTNRVASPTKFAEYLSAGLPVLISEGLGDFSDLVRSEGLGQVVDGKAPWRPLQRPSQEERQRLRQFARDRFTKAMFDPDYRALLRALKA